MGGKRQTLGLVPMDGRARVGQIARFLLLAFIVPGCPGTVAAGELDTPGRTSRPFQIGYVLPEAKEPMAPEWFRRLKHFLQTAPETAKLRAALPREPDPYDGFRLIAAEGFHDLVDRMKADEPELDMVFCPAVAYCQVVKDDMPRRLRAEGDSKAPALEQRDTYRVIFQVRGPYDVSSKPHIFRYGVIFVNARHPLFRPPEERARQPVPLAVIAEHFTSEPVALVSRYSATGYYYPCHALAEATPRALPTQPVFCFSSEEVVKMVLSDMVGMGACEKGVLDQMLGANRYRFDPEQVVDQLVPTSGAPPDPIVFRSTLSPQTTRLLKDALRLFFEKHRPEGHSLVDSDDEVFADLKSVLKAIDEKRRGK